MDHRAEIKSILKRNGKEIKWLKDKLPFLDIYYLLGDTSKNFDVGSFELIMSVLRKEGFIVNEVDRTKRFMDKLIKLNGIINHSGWLLNSNAEEFVGNDGVLDDEEKAKLLVIIKEMEANFYHVTENVKKIIEG